MTNYAQCIMKGLSMSRLKDKLCKIVSEHSKNCFCEPEYCKFVNELYILIEEEK